MKARKATSPLSFLALAVVLVACGFPPSTAPPAVLEPPGTAGVAVPVDPAVVNPALHQFARQLARAAADPALLGVIEREALRRLEERLRRVETQNPPRPPQQR